MVSFDSMLFQSASRGTTTLGINGAFGMQITSILEWTTAA